MARITCEMCDLRMDEGRMAEHVRTFHPQGRNGAPAQTPVLVVTTNDIAGYRIEHVHGDVFGVIVRARNMFSNMGASLRTVGGGEVVGYTRMIVDSRLEARARLTDEARKLGANAVVAMRYDCNEIGDIMSEVAAYGTAVTVCPIAPVAMALDVGSASHPT